MIVSKLSIAHFLISKTRRGKQKKKKDFFPPFQNIILLIKYKRRSTRSTDLFLFLMGEERKKVGCQYIKVNIR